MTGFVCGVVLYGFYKTALDGDFPATFNAQASGIQEPSPALFAVDEGPRATEQAAQEKALLGEKGRGEDVLEKTDTGPGRAYCAGYEGRCAEESFY